MAVDAALLNTARQAQERLVDASRATDIARAEFHHAVRRLHLAGGSTGEIAEALGLTPQRVEQIVEAGGGGWRSSVSHSRGGLWDAPDCSFCGKAQPQVRKLIAGPHACICDQCIATADQVITTGEPAATALSAVKPVGADLAATRCSFCDKTRQQVSGLAAAGSPAICTECLHLCHEILAEELA